METDPVILNSPLKVRDTLSRMMASSDYGPTITEGEVQSIAADIEAAEAVAKDAEPQTGADLVIYGEGASGERPVPTMVESSRTRRPLSPDESLDGVKEEMNLVDDPGADSDSDGSPAVAGPTPSADWCTIDDLNDLSDGIDAAMADHIRTRMSPAEVRIEAHEQSLESLRLLVTNLSEKVTSLSVLVSKLSAPPITTQPTATKRTSVASASKPPGPPETIADRVTVKPIASTEKIQKFLEENPVFPKVAAVRKAKISRLLQQVGSSKTSVVVSADEWTVNGLQNLL